MSDPKELEVKARSLASQANALTVADQQSYDIADALSSGAKDILKAMDASYDPVIKAAHEAHKAAVKAKKDQYEPVEAAMRTINAKMTAWYKLEQARAEASRRASEELARKAAEDAQIAQAELLASMGLDKAADEALEAAPVYDAVKVPEPPKGDGVFYRDSYSAEVTDLLELVKAVAAGKAPLACVEASMTYLNGAARVMKAALGFPGVRVVKSTTQGRR